MPKIPESSRNGHVKEDEIDRIAPALLPLSVDISLLIYDPNNARLHPERSISAIKQSLQRYGQVKPIVVRKSGMMVVAGNGTLQAAREMGWTKIAANVVDMTEIESSGYGLADNRVAELSQWDAEVVARLTKLQEESNDVAVGWTLEELTKIRGVIEAPESFPEFDENLPTDHQCPKCGYRFSGGS